nr:MAG TPA: hypothetical protein [Caudoviricetes sp.]
MSANNDYSEEFDRLRRNRVEVSYHKYGPARKILARGGWTPWRRPSCAWMRSAGTTTLNTWWTRPTI